MTFYERVENLCAEKGISADKLCKDLGLSNATATKWRKGAEPRNATKKAVADYFDVSLEYISGETENRQKEKALQEIPEGLSELDAEIIKIYSTLPEEKKQQALSYLEFLLKQGAE